MAGFGSGFEPQGGGGEKIAWAFNTSKINIFGSAWWNITFDLFGGGDASMWDSVNKRLIAPSAGIYKYSTYMGLVGCNGGSLAGCGVGVNAGGPTYAPIDYKVPTPIATGGYCFLSPVVPITIVSWAYFTTVIWYDGTAGTTRGDTSPPKTYGIAMLEKVR